MTTREPDRADIQREPASEPSVLLPRAPSTPFREDSTWRKKAFILAQVIAGILILINVVGLLTARPDAGGSGPSTNRYGTEAYLNWLEGSSVEALADFDARSLMHFCRQYRKAYLDTHDPVSAYIVCHLAGEVDLAVRMRESMTRQQRDDAGVAIAHIEAVRARSTTEKINAGR